MNLQELVSKVRELAELAPDIETYMYDAAPEFIEQFHSTNTPALMHVSEPDLYNLRSDEHKHNVCFWFYDTYFQEERQSISLEQKYSNLNKTAVMLVKELIADSDVILDGDLNIQRGVDEYNDSLVVIKVDFKINLYDCNVLLKEPTGLTASYASTTSLDIAWTDRSSDETGYELYRSEDNSTFTLVTSLAADATEYTDSGLTEDTSYYYKVRGISADSRSVFSAVTLGSTVTPITPATPPILENLELYVNPDEDVYSDDIGTLAVDGVNIRQVSDQSDNGVVLDQSTASSQFVYAKDHFGTGLSAINSPSGSTRHMDFTSTITIPGETKSLTFYTVYDKTNTSGISYLFGTTDNNFNRILEYNNHSIYFQDTDGDTHFATITNAADLAIRAFTLDTSTDTISTYVNGTLVNSSASSKTWGDFNFDSFWGGANVSYIGSTLLYSDLHDAAQVEQVTDWLNEKYTIY